MPWKQTLKKISLLLVALLLMPSVAFANPPAQSSSSHYQLDEVFFGSGGELNACSTNYCSKQSAGEVTVGRTCGTTVCAQGGFNTDRSPYIEMDVNNTSINVGNLSASGSKWNSNAYFTVKAYLAHGYSVINASPPPTNGGYSIHTDSVPTASTVGTEQFGMNVVANTSPATTGADPFYDPDNTFSFGLAGAEYGTTNQYMYSDQPGLNEVAYSNASSSATKYTITYIFNISNVTPGGTYTMQHVLVATGTY
jgi:hypothetical protein